MLNTHGQARVSMPTVLCLHGHVTQRALLGIWCNEEVIALCSFRKEGLPLGDFGCCCIVLILPPKTSRRPSAGGSSLGWFVSCTPGFLTCPFWYADRSHEELEERSGVD